MNFDRNTVIGFIVLAILFFGYFIMNSREQQKFAVEKARMDSTKRVSDSINRYNDSLRRFKNSPGETPAVAQQKDTTTAGFSAALNGQESITTVENEVIKIGFTNKGGQPRFVELKNFKGPDSSDVKLGATNFDKLTYNVSIEPNKTAPIDTLYFSGPQQSAGADGSKIIEYKLVSREGQQIVHQYVIHPKNYMIDFNITINGVPQVIGSNSLNLVWQYDAVQQQKDVSYERTQSQITYKENGDYDSKNVMGGNSRDFEHSINWIGVKQQFFNATLIAKNNFSSGSITWNAPTTANTKTVVEAIASLKAPLQGGQNATLPLSIYYGPTDYKILKQYGNDMQNMVNLGSGIFSFVKYINRYVILPVFDLFSKFTRNFGIVILLLTLFIRLIISPLTYSSYLSGAKMKVLRPEIDQLKAKHGSDQQAMSMEQMKLFREAGVNPLGGCIPAVLQIPIFFALYSFFNSNVALRGQSFLWAKDLSQYDSVLDFGNIPVISSIYGNHISLFTITAVITSFMISMYSMSMTPDQGNPVLKYMPYFFPIVLLFIFNKLPAGLTWYYTVSNLITLGLQFVILTYIIDHDKILAGMEANRKKPKTKSKWQQRMDEMQQQQKQMQQKRK
jgi:YidC/Oxa1 family membrane protein insertase